MSKFLELPVGHTGIAKLTWLCRGVEFFLVMIKKIFTQVELRDKRGGPLAKFAFEGASPFMPQLAWLFVRVLLS